MKRIFAAAGAVLTLFAWAAATDFYEFYAVWAPREPVILMPGALRVTLAPGEAKNLSLITRPDGVAVDWSSERPDICRVADMSATGCTVIGASEGECRVTVASGDSRAAVQVVVRKPQVHLTLEPDTLTLDVGEVETLHARLQPDTGDGTIRWRISGAEDVAALSYGGKVCRVKALRAGEFTVLAESDGGARAQAQVRVNPPSGNGGFRLTVTLLTLGAFGLIASGILMWRRQNEEK